MSGTTSMLAISNTGYVSLTQSGVNTGWFDPTRGLVTIGVSSTGTISGTDGYYSGHIGIGVAPNASYSLYSSGIGVFLNALYANTFNFNGNTGALNWAGNTVNISGNSSAGNQYLAFTTSGTEAMRIVSSGFVGIGTSAPNSKLEVAGTVSASSMVAAGNILANATLAGTNLSLAAVNGTGGMLYWFDTNNNITGSYPSKYIALTTSGTEAMRIVSSGWVGIGTSAPSGTLHVNGNVIANVYQLRRPSDGTYTGILNTRNASATLFIRGLNSGLNPVQPTIIFENTGANALMSIYSTGALPSVGIGIEDASPTATLEVSGTVSATQFTGKFVGDGSGLTGIVAGNSDRIVSGSVNMVAEQISGTVRVSGTLAMVNTGNEVCGPATWYSFRANPITGQMQMCRP